MQEKKDIQEYAWTEQQSRGWKSGNMVFIASLAATLTLFILYRKGYQVAPLLILAYLVLFISWIKNRTVLVEVLGNNKEKFKNNLYHSFNPKHWPLFMKIVVGLFISLTFMSLIIQLIHIS